MKYEVRHPLNIGLYGNFVELEDVKPCRANCRCAMCVGIRKRLSRKRSPYDELYVKMKASQDYWS